MRLRTAVVRVPRPAWARVSGMGSCISKNLVATQTSCQWVYELSCYLFPACAGSGGVVAPLSMGNRAQTGPGGSCRTAAPATSSLPPGLNGLGGDAWVRRVGVDHRSEEHKA